jgi:hypothetical protein
MILWLMPMTKKLQKKFFIFVEILRAWSSIEVFVLAILTSLVALERFVGFIVGNNCIWIDHTLNEHFPWIFPLDKCLVIKTVLLPGFWVLLISVLFLISLGHVIMFSCHCIYHKNEYSKFTIWIIKFFSYCKILKIY